MGEINKSVEQELDALGDDAGMDEVRERARRVAKEAFVYYEAFREAGFTEGQSFELLLTSTSVSMDDFSIGDPDDEI